MKKLINENVIAWLLLGDISIRFQTQRDLRSNFRQDLQERIETEGWGLKYLSLQNRDGHWGRKFYQPKWTSTHYTLLDLKNLGVSPNNAQIRKTICMLLAEEKGEDGGINPSKAIKNSDVCLNGMFLNYASYFNSEEAQLQSVVDFILAQISADGGFNCRFNSIGAQHSSLHSTLSVLEGILEFTMNGYKYRASELKKAESSGREFILKHRLYISDQTNEIINRNFLKLTYPSRWKYDILKALDYFRLSGFPFDARMQPAIEVLLKKRKNNHFWLMQAKHPGATHFEMEETGKPSRWNTLRALRVLKHFKVNI
ncbi:MAG: hypothetical protein DWQ05_08060 [Calditrichaeota bacterium]|nr:MAG: hypothetical protein DWQ05_08060 [Calditrichota bacterium]